MRTVTLKPCTYCGMPSSQLDHVVPRHLLKRMEEVGVAPCSWRVLKAPTCEECNSALGGMVHKTLFDRRNAARSFIRRKYASFLKMPEWAEEDLVELSPALQDEIRLGLLIKATTKLRLTWTNPQSGISTQEALAMKRQK